MTVKDGASRKRISRDPTLFHLLPLPPREMADDSFVSFIFNESSVVTRRIGRILCSWIEKEE